MNRQRGYQQPGYGPGQTPLRRGRWGCTTLTCASCVLVVGLTLLLVGILVPISIQHKLDAKVKRNIVVDSEDDAWFPEWQKNYNEGDAPHYRSFWFYHLTNEADVLTGRKPLVQERGPYVYREFVEKNNVEFVEGGNSARFDERRYYVFDAAQSLQKGDAGAPPVQLSDTDEITTVNAAYMALVRELRSEADMVGVLSGEELRLIVEDKIQGALAVWKMSQTAPLVQAMHDRITTTLHDFYLGELSVHWLEKTRDKALPPTGSPELAFFTAEKWALNSHFHRDDDPEHGRVGLLGMYEWIHKESSSSVEGIDECRALTLETLTQAAADKLWNGVPSDGKGSKAYPGIAQDAGMGLASLLRLYRETPDERHLMVEAYGLNTEGELDCLVMYVDKYLFTDQVAVWLAGEQEALDAEVKLLFAEQWQNGTVWDLGMPSDLATGKPYGFELDVRPDFSDALVAKLWDKDYDFSFINSKGPQLWAHTSEYEPNADELAARFPGLTSDGAAMLVTWFTSLVDNYIPNALVQEVAKEHDGVHEWEDLAFLQWATNGVTGATVDEHNDMAGVPEFKAFVETEGVSGAPTLTAEQAKTLLQDSAHGLFNSTNFEAFVTLVGGDKAADYATVKAQWHLDEAPAKAMHAYLEFVRSTWIDKRLLKEFSESTGGYFATHSVSEWLFGYEDPLLKLVNAEHKNLWKHWLFTNHTAADAHFRTSEVYTGLVAEDKVDTLKEWHGRTDVEGVWSETVPVRGHRGTQFPPGTDVEKSVVTWSEELWRPIEWTSAITSEVHGVTVNDFTMTKATLEPDAHFHQTIMGIANVTAIKQSAMFLSKPHYLDTGADSPFAEVEGLSTANRTSMDSFLSVEPITGRVLAARKTWQLVAKSKRTDKYFTEIPEVYVPILWWEERFEITEANASDFKRAYYTPLKQKRDVGLSCGVLGGLLLVAGIVWVFVLQRQRRLRMYAPAAAERDGLVRNPGY